MGISPFYSLRLHRILAFYCKRIINPMRPVNCYLRKAFLLTTFSRSWLLSFFLFPTCFVFSQTTNIDSIVNSYHKVLAISTTAAKLDNVTGLAYGNTVLLIQMKGANISTAFNSTFGDINSLNSAGNYEVATICSISHDTVYFFNQVLSTYDVNYSVQLVKFGEYYSANVTDSVKAQSWNNANGKGGVLAIKVEQDLILNAPLFADSTGYNGGNALISNSTCNSFTNGYVYDANFASPQLGAFKGEGVADVIAANSGGRGAPANGGGGGNNHNNGGGGGANLVAGGNGGGNYTTVFGACTGDYHGIGGKALSNAAGTKIFAGGGGGAGHFNNNPTTHGGGDGGGIIIVIAKNIIGNGYKISANGRVGGSGGSDGASGGGAGGTVIMNVTNSYSGSLSIEANGGNGGNTNNQSILNRCYGAGGGGSGGVIYFNGAIPGGITTYDTAGTAGKILSSNGCGVPVPASDGTDGSVVTNYSYRTSVIPSSGCAITLPVRIIYFNAILKADKKVKLEWDIANPEEVISFTIEKINSINNWTELQTIGTQTNLHHYEILDNAPAAGENIYRLRIKAKDNSLVYSIQKRVVLKFNDQFSFYPNPARNKIMISGKLNAGTVIKLTDITGREIKKIITNTSSTSFEFLLPSIDPGIYFLRVDNYTEKIVILH